MRLAWAFLAILIALAPHLATADGARTSTNTLFAPPPPPVDPVRLFGWEAGAAAAATLVAAPVALGIGAAWGSAPSDLILSALPPLVLLIAGPSAAAAGAAWWVGDDLSRDRERFWPAFGLAAAAQLGVVVLAAVTGASAREPRDVVLFSLVDATVLGGVTAGSMALFRPDPDERVVRVEIPF